MISSSIHLIDVSKNEGIITNTRNMITMSVLFLVKRSGLSKRYTTLQDAKRKGK